MTPQSIVRPWEARRLHPQFLSADAGPPSLQSHVRLNDLPSATGKPRLLDQVREAMRTRHYSLRTEKAYVHWIKRFILFHNKRHPRDLAAAEVRQFLSFLATE